MADDEDEDYDDGHDYRGDGCRHPSPSFVRYFGGGPVMTPDEQKDVLDEIRRAIGGQEAEEKLVREVRRDVLEKNRPPDTLACMHRLIQQFGADAAAVILAGEAAIAILHRIGDEANRKNLYAIAADLQERWADEREFSLHEVGLWLTDHVCLCDACWR